MKLSIVIPAYNAAATLEQCLASVLGDTSVAHADREIIVVDNGSTDATRTIAQQAGVRVIGCATKGPAATRNAGFDVATGFIVGCVDSDCTVEQGWCAAILSAFAKNPQLGAVGGEIVAAYDQTAAERHAIRARILNQLDAVKGLPDFLPFVITANAAFRRSSLRHVGFFDESLRWGEDADLSWRMQWNGWQVAYEPSARVRHHHRSTTVALWSQVRDYGIGTAMLFAKHRHRAERRDTYVRWNALGNPRRAAQRFAVAALSFNKVAREESWMDLTTTTASLWGQVIGWWRTGVLIL